MGSTLNSWWYLSCWFEDGSTSTKPNNHVIGHETLLTIWTCYFQRSMSHSLDSSMSFRQSYVQIWRTRMVKHWSTLTWLRHLYQGPPELRLLGRVKINDVRQEFCIDACNRSFDFYPGKHILYEEHMFPELKIKLWSLGSKTRLSRSIITMRDCQS